MAHCFVKYCGSCSHYFFCFYWAPSTPFLWARWFGCWTMFFVSTGCSLGTVNCNIPFIFYLILFLALLMLFLSSIYREVLLLSGRTCQNLNHNCAKVMTSHWSNFENMQDNIENEGWNKHHFFPHACSRLLCVLACMDLCIFFGNWLISYELKFPIS